MFNKLKKRIKETGHNIVYNAVEQYMNSNPQHTPVRKISTLAISYDVKEFPILIDKYTPIISSAQRRMYYKNKFGLLDYHIDFFNNLTSKINLSGKTVLEIGGSNHPKELTFKDSGAKKWVCIDKPWEYNRRDSHIHYSQVAFKNFDEETLSEVLEKENYIIYNGYAEKMTEDFFNQFDLCVSNCSFEHIARLPVVLDLIFNSLKKDGILFAEFAPIWSAHSGHHIFIEDETNSTKFTFQDWPEELQHCHLYMGYIEVFEYLEKHFGNEFAKKHARDIINPDGLNKFFYEDYLFLMHKTNFKQKSVSSLPWRPKVNAEIINMLRNKYQGYVKFDVFGITIQAIK